MLSKKAKYALNALRLLTKEYGKGPILIASLAKEGKIPRKFLEIILLELKNAGILQSKKGQGGGYYLRKHPSEVPLSDVIRLIDGPIALLPCATYKYYEKCEECEDEETCGIRSVIKEVRDAAVAILKRTTLEGLLEREKKLKRNKKKLH